MKDYAQKMKPVLNKLMMLREQLGEKVKLNPELHLGKEAVEVQQKQKDSRHAVRIELKLSSMI